MAATWVATVRGTYRTPEAGTRTQYVQVREPPCASGACPTREAGTRSPYVPYGGPGAFVSAQAATAPPRWKAASDWRKRSGRIAPVKTTALPFAAPLRSSTWADLGLGVGVGVGVGSGLGLRFG